MLGLALLGACAGDPTPGPLMVGGRLSVAFTQLARAELQASFRLAPTLVSLAPAPSAFSPPVPVPQPRLVVAPSLFPPPRNPVTHERIRLAAATEAGAAAAASDCLDSATETGAASARAARRLADRDLAAALAAGPAPRDSACRGADRRPVTSSTIS